MEMLDNTALAMVAAAVNDRLFEAHRGALLLRPNSRRVIVFTNEGYDASDKGRAAVAKARAVLAADGYTLGPVATDPDGYTAVFEAAPPPAAADPLDVCEEAIWEGFAAARDLDTVWQGISGYQRELAATKTTGVTAEELTQF